MPTRQPFAPFLSDMIPLHAVDAFKPLIGFLGAIASGVAYELAQAVPVIPDWFEQGAAVLLVSCLTYAVITLWKTVQKLTQESKEDRDHYHEEVARAMKARLEDERDERAKQRVALDGLTQVLRKMSEGDKEK